MTKVQNESELEHWDIVIEPHSHLAQRQLRRSVVLGDCRRVIAGVNPFLKLPI